MPLSFAELYLKQGAHVLDVGHGADAVVPHVPLSQLLHHDRLERLHVLRRLTGVVHRILPGKHSHYGTDRVRTYNMNRVHNIPRIWYTI